MYKKNKSKLYVLSVFFIKSLILFFVFLPVTNFVFKVKKNDLYAQSRRGGSRRSSARSGSVKKKPARSGSSTKKSSARSGSIKKGGSSIRSGSMIRRIGDHSARSGSLSNNLPSSSKTTNSNQNQPKTSPDKFAGIAGDKQVSMCMYAYVNCMDAMIGYILKKNPYLDTDKAVADMMSKDKPFRCVFATGNYNKANEISIKNGKIEFVPTEKDSADEKISVVDGLVNGNNKIDQAKSPVIDWAANALYKKYNYFCSEKDNTVCEYDFGANNKYFASKQATAYYMDIYSRIKGGCSNGSVDWGDEDGDEEELKNSCKSTEGRWYKPNSLKMTDMNNELMGELGFSSSTKGKCYSSENKDACIASGRIWEVNKCFIEAATTKEQCEDQKMFNATWERQKEWSFAVNVPPPSMTLNSGEEFAIASNMCFVGATDVAVIKSKKIKVFKENLHMKGIPDNVINSIVEAQDGDKAGYVDVLSKCGEYRENLEDYYQSGMWPEKGSDQTSSKSNKTLDEFFVTAPKSCEQYELSLKSVRQTWKGKTTEAITETAKELERKMKTDEVKDLKADLNVNMQVAQMSNEIYKQCLGEFRSCINKNCGKNYSKCVSTEGLNKSTMTDVGLLCYPGYKICMDTTSKTLDTSQMSPQLRKIVMEMDTTKMSEMAMDSVKESLKEEYNKIMGDSCASAGGFFYGGMCGIMFMDIKMNSTASVNEVILNIAARGEGDCSDKGRKKGKCTQVKKETVKQKTGSTTEEKTEKMGVALPGVSFTYNKTQSKSTASGGDMAGIGVTQAVTCKLNDVEKTAGPSWAVGSKTGSGDHWSATATTSCNITEDMAVIMQKDEDIMIKQASKGVAPFIPAGWSNIVEQQRVGQKHDQKCFSSGKMQMAGTGENKGKDAVSLLFEKLKETEETTKTGTKRNRCTPKGYMDYEVEQMFENDWQKIFKSIASDGSDNKSKSNKKR